VGEVTNRRPRHGGRSGGDAASRGQPVTEYSGILGALVVEKLAGGTNCAGGSQGSARGSSRGQARGGRGAAAAAAVGAVGAGRRGNGAEPAEHSAAYQSDETEEEAG